jgi:uracil DNA glycosylase
LNIYKELESRPGPRTPAPKHGFLEHWARQGVLLLNSVLTVEMAKAASHSQKGWERFTDAVIRLVNAKPDPVVFLLWGSLCAEESGLCRQFAAPCAEGRASFAACRPITAFWGAAIFRKPMPFWKSTDNPP